MKYAAYLLAALVFLGAVYTIGTYEKNAGTTRGPTAQAPALPDGVWPQRVDSQNGVSVEVRPVVTGSEGQWKFALTFTTHTGSLDADLMQVASLIDDSGTAYKPKQWDGPPPGGHHIAGTLVFDTVRPTRFVELKLNDIGGIPERGFRWDLP